jgi:hypothetical protein
LQDSDPIFVIPAATDVAESRGRRVDRTKVERLVELLDSEDAAVRLASIGALKELSGGEDFGYQFWLDEAQRIEATDRWKAWLAARR